MLKFSYQLRKASHDEITRSIEIYTDLWDIIPPLNRKTRRYQIAKVAAEGDDM